ncbi:hypothetical protein Nmel_012948, partial [Mimus melanotis]
LLIYLSLCSQREGQPDYLLNLLHPNRSQSPKRQHLRKKKQQMIKRRTKRQQQKGRKEPKAKRKLNKRMLKKKTTLKMEIPKLMRHQLLKHLMIRKPSPSNVNPALYLHHLVSVPPCCIVNREEYFYQLFYKCRFF